MDRNTAIGGYIVVQKMISSESQGNLEYNKEEELHNTKDDSTEILNVPCSGK